MKYQIIGKNITVTDGIRHAVEKKLSRMDKYFHINDDVTCRVVVRSYKVGAKIEVTIFTPQMDFRAEVTNNDLYAGVDFAIDKLEGQMRKLKTRLDKTKSKLSLGKSIAFENIEVDKKVEKEENKVVRMKSYYLDGMSIEEAIIRMEVLDHPFYIYLDSDDDRISVCYKREEGGYGVIQAENPLK